MTRPRLEVADVFRQHADAFLERYGAGPPTNNAASCMTSPPAAPPRWAVTSSSATSAATGRSPTTPAATAIAPSARPSPPPTGWRPAQAELLPVEYFHLVFTLPTTLNPIALQNPRVVYGLLFRAAAETLQQVAADPKHLGAEIGFFAVLHTWGQNLQHHPHVHCVVPGGGIAPDASRWIACPPGFFLPVRVLSRVFRGKFLSLLRNAFDRGRLAFHGKLGPLAEPEEFQRRLADSARTEWVVYAKPPFGGPQQVLKYLARYTHRVAISNSRLVATRGRRVTFRWKDYAHGGKQK